MKKEYIILALIIAALSAYIVLKSTDKQQYSLPETGNVSRDDITEVGIQKEGGTILLTRQDKTWVVSEKHFPADSKTVDDVLSDIEKLEVTALVSENKDYVRYELDPEKRIKVTAKKGDDILREFEIGKPAPTFKHTFVRLAGDDHVYHAAGNFRSHFDKDLDAFRNKTVLSFDKKTLKGMRMEKDGKTRELVYTKAEADGAEEGTWSAPDGASLDEKQVERLVSSLSKFECNGFTGEETKEKYASHTALAVLTVTTDKEMSITVYEKSEDDKFPGLSSENPYPFYLDSYQVDNMMERMDTILGIIKEADKNSD